MNKVNIKRSMGIIIILIGLGLIAYPFIQIKMDNNKIENNISEWDKQKEQVISDMDSNKDDSKKNENKTVVVDGKEIFGKIKVNKSGEEIPILIGATTENLKHGANIYENNILPGDEGTVVILGHRETTFGFLENIKNGDEIEIETLKNTFKYKVDKTYITNPEDEKILEQRKGKTLTLITCYPFNYVGPAPERFVVNLTEI